MDMFSEVDHPIRVTPLVVVPGDDLVEVFVEGEAGLLVVDRGVGVVEDVGGNDLVLSVAQHALELAVG
jgi:hypothetical protein